MLVPMRKVLLTVDTAGRFVGNVKVLVMPGGPVQVMTWPPRKYSALKVELFVSLTNCTVPSALEYSSVTAHT